MSVMQVSGVRWHACWIPRSKTRCEPYLSNPTRRLIVPLHDILHKAGLPFLVLEHIPDLVSIPLTHTKLISAVTGDHLPYKCLFSYLSSSTFTVSFGEVDTGISLDNRHS